MHFSLNSVESRYISLSIFLTYYYSTSNITSPWIFSSDSIRKHLPAGWALALLRPLCREKSHGKGGKWREWNGTWRERPGKEREMEKQNGMAWPPPNLIPGSDAVIFSALVQHDVFHRDVIRLRFTGTDCIFFSFFHERQNGHHPSSPASVRFSIIRSVRRSAIYSTIILVGSRTKLVSLVV